MSPIMVPSSPYPGCWGKRMWPSSAWPGTLLAATLQTPSSPGSSVKVTISLLSPKACSLWTYNFFSYWFPWEWVLCKNRRPLESHQTGRKVEVASKVGSFSLADCFSFPVPPSIFSLKVLLVTYIPQSPWNSCGFSHYSVSLYWWQLFSLHGDKTEKVEHVRFLSCPHSCLFYLIYSINIC